MTGWAAEVLVGHCTYAGLMTRGTLCVFHTIYAFIRKSYAAPTALWPEARGELETFRGLMLFLESDWSLQWNDLVVATDSSLEAGAVSTTRWPRAMVAMTGRQQERARFRPPRPFEEGPQLLDPRPAARESALTAAGFWRDEGGEWRLADPEALDELGAGWVIDPNFEEVPATGLAAQRWRTKQVLRWRFEEGILIKGARALVMGLRRVAQSVFGAASRQLILSDNMSVVLAFNRCRAKDHALLVQIRRFQAYSRQKSQSDCEMGPVRAQPCRLWVESL